MSTPVPPECQPFVDEMEQLRSEMEDVGGLAGPEKWAAAQANSARRAKISQLQRQLETCLLQQGAGYATDVSIIDLTPGGSTVALPAEGTYWQIAGGVQTPVEGHAVQGGRLAFSRGASQPPASVGISVRDAPNPTFTGPLFRSGPFATLPSPAPGNPAGLIDIFVPGPVTLSSAAVAAALPAPGSIPVPAPFVVTSLTPTLNFGSVTLAIAGTVTVTLPVVGTLAIPATFTFTFALAPSTSMSTPTEVVVVTAVPPPATLASPGGGFAGALVGMLSPALAPLLTSTATTAVQTAVNGTIATTAAAAFGMSALPPGATVSMRRIVVTPSGIVLFPTLTRYGP